MIINIFGASGSGKTTYVKKLLKKKKIATFFESFSKENHNDLDINKVSISLIPLPKFRGSVKELFEIFSIDINILMNLDNELNELLESVFGKILDRKKLENIFSREIETLSAGEIRRLFLLKTLLVDSKYFVLDEPFSNSDQKLWEIIYKAISKKNNSIVLSHLSLENLFNSDIKNISVHISNVNNNFL
tara:strand:- start:1793 stop:2359 length:567 start_codon:yes stop_codon:yes gene_type:complete